MHYFASAERNMKEIRCPKCNKLLLKANTVVGEIKCKCGEIVKLKIISQSLLHCQNDIVLYIEPNKSAKN